MNGIGPQQHQKHIIYYTCCHNEWCTLNSILGAGYYIILARLLVFVSNSFQKKNGVNQYNVRSCFLTVNLETTASQNKESHCCVVCTVYTWLNDAAFQHLSVINAAVIYDIFLRSSPFITKPRLFRAPQNNFRTLIILIFYHGAVLNQDHYSR